MDASQALPPPADTPPSLVTLPEVGEALLSPKIVFAALGIGESTGWEWVRTDPAFPRPVRRGERFTRFRLSEVRAYIASMATGTAKIAPSQRRRLAEAA